VREGEGRDGGFVECEDYECGEGFPGEGELVGGVGFDGAGDECLGLLDADAGDDGEDECGGGGDG
jgi:hypothetical protein